MVLPGGDFLASLQDLFKEAGAEGRDLDTNFNLLKEPIICFAQACGRMTAARARATFDPTFTDGRRPDTAIQLPPKTIKLSVEAIKRLRGADSGNEFIGIFRTVIDESMPEKKTRKRKRPAAKVQAQAMPIPEPTKPRPKIVVKKKSISDSDRNETGEEKAWNSLKASLFQDITKASPLAEFVRKPEGNWLPIKSENDSDSLEFQQDGPVPMDLDKKIDTDGVRVDLLPSLESNTSKLESERGNNAGPMQAQAEDTAAGRSLEDATEDQTNRNELLAHSQDVEMTENPQKSTQYIIQENEMANPGSYEASTLAPEKPQIDSEHNSTSLTLTSHSEEGNGEMLGKVVAEESAEDSLTLLKEGISRIGNEIEDIPEERWQKYQAMLFDLCALYDLTSISFKERLSKIARIIYIQEEETALNTKDWSKLPSAARICAFLAQTTGTVTDQSIVDGWVIGRLRDINFLVARKIFDLTAESEVTA